VEGRDSNEERYFVLRLSIEEGADVNPTPPPDDDDGEVADADDDMERKARESPRGVEAARLLGLRRAFIVEV
jgi:hypothetical protein